MKYTRTDVKARLREVLVKLDVDEYLAKYRFSRRKNSLVYSRALPEAIQKIDVSIGIHPRDRRDALADVYPWLEINMMSLEKPLLEMFAKEAALKSSNPTSTMRQPMGFTSAKADFGRWFIWRPDSTVDVVRDFVLFLDRWTLPFLNSYTNPSDMCAAYERKDIRVINTLEQALRVVAAMVLTNRFDDALAIMTHRFGKPGIRKGYESVFSYLNALKSESR